MGGLIGNKHKIETPPATDIFWRSAYIDNYEISKMLFCAGSIRGSDIKSITFGPHLFEKSTAYWEERRDKTSLVGRAGPSCHLDLACIDESWELDHDETKSVMRGLCELPRAPSASALLSTAHAGSIFGISTSSRRFRGETERISCRCIAPSIAPVDLVTLASVAGITHVKYSHQHVT